MQYRSTAVTTNIIFFINTDQQLNHKMVSMITFVDRIVILLIKFSS